jgi:hypothetical protein
VRLAALVAAGATAFIEQIVREGDVNATGRAPR